MEDLQLESLHVNKSAGGRKRIPHTTASSGHYFKAQPIEEGEQSYQIAVDATLRAAMLRNMRELPEEELHLLTKDLRKKIYQQPQKTLIIFLVDSSDSMGEGTFARIKAAKGAILAILAKAYQKRHRVGMVVFREESAEVILQPTSSLTLAKQKLKALPIGGATPFSAGLMQAWRLMKTERLKDKGIKPLLVILSDGEANVPYDKTRKLTEVMDELFAITKKIGQDNISTITIDTGPLSGRSDNMNKIAKLLGGTYHHISRLKSVGMVRLVADF